MNRGLYVVMGVSGSGKSVIGAAFARALGVDFVEGDDYHTPANVERMSSGVPLTDADRAEWLRSLAERIRDKDLVIVPTGALCYLPFELLREAGKGGATYLIEGVKQRIAVEGCVHAAALMKTQPPANASSG